MVCGVRRIPLGAFAAIWKETINDKTKPSLSILIKTIRLSKLKQFHPRPQNFAQFATNLNFAQTKLNIPTPGLCISPIGTIKF
jgi:hypothetical protein